jgi:phosphate transport system substrate-binding protein
MTSTTAPSVQPLQGHSPQLDSAGGTTTSLGCESDAAAACVSRRRFALVGGSLLCCASGCASWGDASRTNTTLEQGAAGVEPAAGSPAPADTSRLPTYRRARTARGTLRLSGSSAVAQLARAWGGAFTRLYADAKVDIVAKSSGAAAADMTADPTTIGMTSRPLNRGERDALTARLGRAPLELKVAVDALALYVFKDNPTASITLEQIERVFAASPTRGQPIERWGQLGVQGAAWADKLIVPVGFAPGRGAYDTMRELVLRGGDFASDVQAEPVATSVVQAVGVEPGAIGYASASLRTARTKLLAVSDGHGPAVLPDEAGASSGRYPLARFLYLHLGSSASPGAAALAREFLRFVLAQEGQELARTNGAFAIAPALAHEQGAALRAP